MYIFYIVYKSSEEKNNINRIKLINKYLKLEKDKAVTITV